MISRRKLVAVVAGASVAPVHLAWAALPVPPGDRIAFQMLRNGDVVGHHELSFVRTGDQLVVSIAIDILVRFLTIPVYRYSHRATERWRGDQFSGIESRTDHNGTDQQMRAVRGAEGVVVEGSKTERYIAPAGALPTTYWNKAMLGPKLINSEDGRLITAAVREGDIEPVRMTTGMMVEARHYALTGEVPLELWYDRTGQWAHLEFTREGSTIIYEKL